jgi:3-oxoacyl-[acyl-carrier protein] reductase
MNLDLGNKIAVVCGSTQGIGLATAHELAWLGAEVVLLARNEEKLQEVCSTLPTPNKQQHRYLVADFQQLAQLQKAIKEFLIVCKSRQKLVHILVNNTGGPPAGLAIDANLEAFQEAFSLHLLCNQLLVQAFVPLMKEANYGRIVNIISTSVKQPLPNLGVSNTIRAAVANWAKTLSFELAAHNITVNNVLPGATKTQRLENIMQNRAGKTQLSIEEVSNEMLKEIPARRFGEAIEVASAVAFLCTPAAAYINGINLPIDGGRLGCL